MMPLIICPPLDSTGLIPSNFIGYYINDCNIFQELLPPSTTSYLYWGCSPGIYEAEISAVYDLTFCGLGGQQGESNQLSTLCIVRYGNPLDFFEDWNSGSFETNNWTTENANWSITGQTGNPAPSATFTWDPVQTNYSISLESYPLQADSIFAGNIYLDFDIRLDAYQSTGDEKMLVQVWNWEDQLWFTVDTFSNVDGSFDWTSSHRDITAYSIGDVFRIRFNATGVNSLDIIGWYIDNIHVYRTCKAPIDLYCEAMMQGIELFWTNPSGFEAQWLQWDDNVNYDAIGTGDAVEFDVASRWTPAQLNQYPIGYLTKVGFYPNEALATYNIRVWTGAGAQNLIVDQPVTDPQIDEWNDIVLQTPVPLDISQELWVGYHVNTQTGHPAGCDDGPAIDGYGNMMNFGGWQTLLQINPDLDYNWNIRAYLFPQDTSTIPDRYVIYRSDDMDPFFILGYSEETNFLDDSACTFGIGAHSYYVSAQYFEENDTCESEWSNETGFLCLFGLEETQVPEMRIYPNPCPSDLFLESEEIVNQVSLYNSNGRQVLTKEIHERASVISVRGLEEGIYLLRMQTLSGIVSRKIVVMR